MSHPDPSRDFDDAAEPAPDSTAVIAIGRNEGDRLRACLDALHGHVTHIIYVDSGSTDNSVAAAQQRGVEVVELDMSIPFSAGRARNAGFARLMEIAPDTRWVQFLDGDCVIDPRWLHEAVRTMEARPDAAIVCGRLRERFPEKTLYNRLCNIEWQSPPGEIDACGGIFLVRAEVFRRVGGFDPAVIAGEEPEMCVRIRNAGWKILRIAAEMALHDADMHRFGQWWRRAVRCGHAYAQVWSIHGRSPDRTFRRQLRSAWVWGVVVPLLIALAAVLTHGWGLLLLGVYPLQWFRAARRIARHTPSRSDARLYAGFCVIAKWAELQGQLKFLLNRLRGRQPRIIEYKTPAPTAPQPTSTPRS